ncbi:hypothetical protein K2173_009304 [Erythroxylum novogranatense]|uniref:Uncharacterized protein n=1 Tax=Erythroxylum novogranatense TaxID=1862640 RepID=A0AAV8U6B5_9ROSI|nr:hypothetical protein K2173_009304 [Erythroxylum novogranatense]
MLGIFVLMAGEQYTMEDGLQIWSHITHHFYTLACMRLPSISWEYDLMRRETVTGVAGFSYWNYQVISNHSTLIKF